MTRRKSTIRIVALPPTYPSCFPIQNGAERNQAIVATSIPVIIDCFSIDSEK